MKKVLTIKRLLFVLYYVITLAASSMLATVIVNRFEYNFLSGNPQYYYVPMLVNMAAMLFGVVIFRLLRIDYRNAGVNEILRIVGVALTIFCVDFVLFCIPWTRNFFSFRQSFIFILIFFDCLVGGVYALRLFLYAAHEITNLSTREVRENVLIVGAGAAGAQLVKEMNSSKKIALNPVGFVDDNPLMLGKMIDGVEVLGASSDIKKIVQEHSVAKIFIAMPSVSTKIVKGVIGKCNETKCEVKILPGIYQLVNNDVMISRLRKVEIADLMPREQVKVNMDEIMQNLCDKVVLVTGGGGSIGSELCRQIAAHQPKRLIILDIYENNAYSIQMELKRHFPDLNMTVLIASIRDVSRLDSIFEKYRPELVFNAAAHKHVPLMEDSPREAIKNNVFGTYNLSLAAIKYGVDVFVQISTDKAVNPTNIMGASKRLCEMVIQSMAKKSPKTRFVAVRFGNVLGSNGSVIPLFKEQIQEGGPVTVTHKDIERYFMTIPEAVVLVLQAAANAKGGEIFVLDMGEPFKIYSLAENLIRLSGYEPNVDIDIKICGLRPGEKLYEERLMLEEGLITTENGMISIAKPINFDEEAFIISLPKLKEIANDENSDIISAVKSLVSTYHPENGGLKKAE